MGIKSLGAAHRAAEIFEVQGHMGFWNCANVVGLNVALALFVAYVRRGYGATYEHSDEKNIEEKVRSLLWEISPQLERFFQCEVGLFYEYNLYALSNFSAFTVRWCDRVWPTAEHAYQGGLKYANNEKIAEMVRAAPSANEAMKIGQTYKVCRRTDFDEVKIPGMKEILIAKHSQHKYVQTTLQRTMGVYLIENSPIDSFWGRGPDWSGENQLGELWMQIRDEKYGV